MLAEGIAMSSSPPREPLPGLIRQKEKVVGAICLPEKDIPAFIAEFNRCYGPLSLHIEAPEFPNLSEIPLVPVGARLRSSPNFVANE